MADAIFAEQGKSLRKMLMEDAEGTLIHSVRDFLNEHRIGVLKQLEETEDLREFGRLTLLESCYENSLSLLDPIADYIEVNRTTATD